MNYNFLLLLPISIILYPCFQNITKHSLPICNVEGKEERRKLGRWWEKRVEVHRMFCLIKVKEEGLMSKKDEYKKDFINSRWHNGVCQLYHHLDWLRI